MAEYEVKVTPTLEIDMERLKSDVKKFSGALGKEVTGKLRLEVDSGLAKKQIQELADAVPSIEVTTKLDMRSIKDVEAELRQRLKRIDELGDVTYEMSALGAKRTSADFEREVQALIEMRVELERLTEVWAEFNRFSQNERSGVIFERADLRDLKSLSTMLQGNEDQIIDTRNAFLELQKVLKNPIEIPVVANLNKIEEAMQALESMGAERFTRKEWTEQFVGDSSGLEEFLRLRKEEGLLVERMSPKLRQEREEREALKKIIEQKSRAQSENLSSIKGQFDSTSGNTAQVIKEETSAVQSNNQAWGEHPDALRDAADAERQKLEISKQLTAQLGKEERAVIDLGAAVDRAESSGDAALAPMLEVDLSNLRFRDVDPRILQQQLEAIFSEAASRQGDFTTAKVRMVLGNTDEVEKAVVTFKDNIGQTIEQTYGLIGKKGEQTFQHLQTTLSAVFREGDKFDIDFNQNLALQQIETLQNAAKGLGMTFDGLIDSAANIVGQSSLQEFKNQFTLAKETIRTAKAELQGLNKLDPIAAMQRNIEGFDTKVGGLIEKLRQLEMTGFRDVPTATESFNDLDAAIANISTGLRTFQSAQDSLSTDQKVEGFNNLAGAISRAENQIKLLSQQQTTHQQAVKAYIAAINQMGKVQRAIGKTDSGDTARLSTLNRMREVLQGKIDSYQALKVSALELAKIESARSDAMSGSASSRSNLLPLNETDIARMQAMVAELQKNLSTINFGISTEATEDAIRRVSAMVEDVGFALENLQNNNGLEGQAVAASDFESKLKLAKDTLRALKKEEGDVRGLTRLQEQADQLDNRLQKMSINWSAFKADPDLEATWTRLRGEIDNMRDSLSAAQEAGGTQHYAALNKEFQALTQQVRTFTTGVQGAGRAKLSFGDTIMATSKKLSAYIVSMFGFTRVIVMFRDALRYIQEIDRAMTALRRVTDETARTYNNFLSEAYRRAQRLGASVNGIINATAD